MLMDLSLQSCRNALQCFILARSWLERSVVCLQGGLLMEWKVLQAYVDGNGEASIIFGLKKY